MSGSLGNATFSLRVDVTNLVSGLNSAKTFVEQATAQIDALLTGIGTGRAGAAAPFASLEAQLATLNATLATYTAQAQTAGQATTTLARPVQLGADAFASLSAQITATDTAAKTMTADWAQVSAALGGVEATAAATGTELERVVAQWDALSPVGKGTPLGGVTDFATASAQLAEVTTAEGAAATEMAALTAATDAWGTTVTAQTAKATESMAAFTAEQRQAGSSLASGLGFGGQGGGILGVLTGGADLGELASGALAFAGGLAAITVGFQALQGAASFAKQSMIDFNAELQADAIRLQNFTGGVDQANRVLTQLATESGGKSFGGFDFSDLEQGTEILARFGVANQQVEQEVADVAAGTGQSYAAVAQQIGRLYDLLDNGQPIGRVAVQLERSGILTASWVSQLEAAQKAGADQAQLDAMLTEALSRYNGQAAQLGDTWGSTTNEIVNSLKLMYSELTKPGFDVLLTGLHDVRDALDAVNTAVQQHSFKALADDLVALNDEIQAQLLGGLLNTPLLGGLLDKTGLQRAVQALQDQATQLQAAAKGQASGGGDGGGYAQAGQEAGQAFAQAFTASSMDQMAQGVARFGDAANPVFQSIVASLEAANPLLGEMIADYQTLATDQAAVRATTLAVADAQQHLADVTKQANDELTGLQQTIANDQAIAQQHANAYQGTIDQLNGQLKDVQDQAKAADDAWTTTIDNLRSQEQTLQQAAADRKQAWQDTISAAQQDLQNLQDKATADQAAFQAQLDSLQQQQQALSDAASQHAAVYKAILDGTIDTYVQLTGKEDDLTQAIRARWQEEVEGQLRAQSGADAAVRAKQEEQDKSTLALDTQIAAAREQGNQREVAALEAKKKQVDAGYAAELQLLNDKKKVADDQFQDTQKQVQQEAQTQAMKDKAAEDANKAQIQGVQDAQKAQKAADDEAIKAQQERIKNLQDQATQQDRTDQAAIKGVQDQITQDQNLKSQQDARFKAEQDNIQTQIAAVQRQQQAQELMDKAKEAADQQHYDDRKAYWGQEETNAKNSVTYAQQAEQAAKDQLTYDTQHLDNLKQQAQWEDYISKIIADRQKLVGAPSNLPALAPTEGPRAGGGAPYVTPPAPGQPGYVSPFPVGTPAPAGAGPTSGRQPVLTAADYRPAGGGVVNQTNTYNVTGADPKTVVDQLGAHVFDATQAALDQASRGGYNLARVRA